MGHEVVLGELISCPAQLRDAIHIAVAPVIAGADLVPGQHVGFLEGTDTVGPCEKTLGIVDPFLNDAVKKGERVWMFLYPNTIRDMRHEWYHPAFSGMQAQASEKWLREFVEEHFGSLTYEELIDGLKDYCANGYSERIHLRESIPDDCFSQRHDLWKHFASVTGIVPDDMDDVPFTCGC